MKQQIELRQMAVTIQNSNEFQPSCPAVEASVEAVTEPFPPSHTELMSSDLYFEIEHDEGSWRASLNAPERSGFHDAGDMNAFLKMKASSSTSALVGPQAYISHLRRF